MTRKASEDDLSGGIQRGQAFALARDRLDAHAAPDRLQDEFLGVDPHADVDEGDHVGAVGVPAFVETPRADQQVDVAVGGVEAFEEAFILEAPDEGVIRQDVFLPVAGVANADQGEGGGGGFELEGQLFFVGGPRHTSMAPGLPALNTACSTSIRVRLLKSAGSGLKRSFSSYR